MKLMVGRRAQQAGFALPTVLLVSIAMITILVASIAAVAASRVSLDSQYYNKLAQQAVESGMARANECLKGSGFAPQWGINAENKDLRPDSDCTGSTLSGPGASAYVVENIGGSGANVRTKYSIDAPSGTGIGSSLRVIGTTELVRTSNPNSVWRSYTQVAHMQIEPPETVACPEGFIPVPGDSRFNTNDFCVGKYEAKNVGGKAVSQAEGVPWVGISQNDAMAVAAAACTGCSLVSEAQWLTVAHNVTNVGSNWSGGSVGSGYIYSGHNDNSPAAALAASSDDSDGYVGTGSSSGNQRRTLRLNNGEVIWDLAGNPWEWTSGQTNGNQPGAAGYTYRDWRAISGTGSLTPNPFPAFATPDAANWTGSAQGIGRVNSSTNEGALKGTLRGGGYTNAANTGVFAATMHIGPSDSAPATVGFRLAFEPLSQTRCPAGHIPVPGNSQFGTKNFCVGKYEAKNVGGVAVSQPAGLPWVSITQTSAIVAANNACTSCRLIGEAEWLTIAHNILNVSSNWTGGSVGSGYVPRGNSNSSAAMDGTNELSGINKRTLTLSNGEVIWDLAGNVWEWTSGQTSVTSTHPGSSGYAWHEWNAISGTGSLTPSPFPAFGTPAANSWTSSHGIGQVYSNRSLPPGMRGFVRGGLWSNGSYAGIFALHLVHAPSTSVNNIGFRVISDPI